MPRKHEQPVTNCPTAEVKAGLQVETVLPRPTRGRRQVAAPSPRVGPVAPRLPRITRLMALAIKFQDMLDRGEVRDYAEIAKLGYVTRARVTQIMNLLNLSPDIQAQLLHLGDAGGKGGEISERHLRCVTSMPSWDDQRARWRNRLLA